MYKDVPRHFMPILWFEQHVIADKSLANLVKLILAAPTAGQILGFVFILLGVTLIFFACLCTRDKYNVPLEDKLKTDIQKTTITSESLPLMRN